MYLRTEDFNYLLPPDRIAAHPLRERDESRLMVLARESGEIGHAVFRELPRLLRARSLLVINDTRVIRARLLGRKTTGGAVEALLVAPMGTARLGRDGSWEEDWAALTRGMGGLSEGDRVDFGRDLSAQFRGKLPLGQAALRFAGSGAPDLLALAEAIGCVPLPPYVEGARRRAGEPAAAPEDEAAYQTVFARAPGAVAAPTAGLHFTQALLGAVVAAGHEVGRITLHVGPGTFRPVRDSDPTAHQMDPERYEIPAETAAAVERARSEGRPVVAVGTTVVRALETVAAAGRIVPGAGVTDLYLLPGAPFRVVTDLVTNFHLPRSTLLMLVAAFAGLGPVLAAYRTAIGAGYRFYSYGDAMFIRSSDMEPSEGSIPPAMGARGQSPPAPDAKGMLPP